jgi:hypothetical protein
MPLQSILNRMREYNSFVYEGVKRGGKRRCENSCLALARLDPRFRGGDSAGFRGCIPTCHSRESGNPRVFTQTRKGGEEEKGQSLNTYRQSPNQEAKIASQPSVVRRSAGLQAGTCRPKGRRYTVQLITGHYTRTLGLTFR